MLAEGAIHRANIELGYGVSGVGLQPEFVGLDFLGYVSQCIVIMGCDVKAFVVGYAIAQFVCLGFVLDCLSALAGAGIDGAEPGVGQGKVRIELDGMLVKGHGFLVPAFLTLLLPIIEGL